MATGEPLNPPIRDPPDDETVLSQQIAAQNFCLRKALYGAV